MIARIRALLATPQVAGVLAFAAASWGVGTLMNIVEKLQGEANRIDAELGLKRKALAQLDDAAAAAPATDDVRVYCHGCNGSWPCPTHPGSVGGPVPVTFTPSTGVMFAPRLCKCGGPIVNGECAWRADAESGLHVVDVDQAAAPAPAP